MVVPSQPKLRAKSSGPQATEAGEPRPLKPLIILVSLSAAAIVAALVGLSPALWSGRSSASGAEAVSERLPTGTIAESDIEFCRRLTFDENGRVFQDAVPCDRANIRDARGQLVPAGTIRRLDAISKSFAGH